MIHRSTDNTRKYRGKELKMNFTENHNDKISLKMLKESLNVVRVPGNKTGETVFGRIVRTGRSGLIHVKHTDGTITAHPKEHIFSVNLDDENYEKWDGKVSNKLGESKTASRARGILSDKLKMMQALKNGIIDKRPEKQKSTSNNTLDSYLPASDKKM